MEFVEARRDELRSLLLRELVSMSLYRPDEAKVDRFLQRLDFRTTRLFVALGEEGAVGQVMVTQSAEEPGRRECLTINSISVHPVHRAKGFGRFLIEGLLNQFPDPQLIAETDGDAVGFYHNCGFRVRSLGKHPGADIVRYRCSYDHRGWAPLPYREAIEALLRTGVRAWVAGGWALDLFCGRQTREHTDTDIQICCSEQALLFAAFPGWEIYRTHAPGLARWTEGEYLDTTPNVWLRRDQDSPWSLEVMFLDTEGEEWVYRRNRAIRGKVQEIGLVTEGGIPYLRPEVQLLFKGGSSALREKDTRDLLAVLPALPKASRMWLARTLRLQFPAGHEWLRHLDPLRAG